MSTYKVIKLSQIIDYTTGKLNSNAALEGGKYPFFTCAKETYQTDTWSFDCECVILAGNNANAEYPIKYFGGGKFDAYQRTYVMTPKDEDKLDIRYLYYVLELKLNLLKTLSTGATTKFLTKTILDDFKIDLPDIGTQRGIVSKLAPLEDLIENNTQRIEILEEMARRIYREWFVHFRYPGHENDALVDSGTELGKIPEGWEVKKLEDVADINPENISTDYKGEIEYINISGVNEGSVDETEIHDFEAAPGRAKRKVNHGDIIWSTVRPNLKAYALIMNPTANKIASTGFAVIRPKKLPASFLYNFSITDYFVQYLVNHTRGSAYPAVNVSDFKNSPILVPNEKLVEKFHQATWSNFLQIDKLSRKTKKLKETRDLLLPKLISGKIDVGDNIEKSNGSYG